MSFVELKVLKNIRHNGVEYTAGDIISQIEADSALCLVELKAAEIIKKEENNDNDNKGKGGKKTKTPAYAELTNTQQIEYLSAFSDDEFLKVLNDELVKVSKSQSKAYIKRREALLTKKAKEETK